MKYFAWMSSIRSWVAILITITFCVIAAQGKVPFDKFYEIVLLVMMFYFLKDRSYSKEEPEKPKSPTVR